MSTAEQPPGVEDFLSGCLCLDLEVDRHKRIREVGAVLGDRVVSSSAGLTPEVARDLDGMARDARFVLGHNLVEFDLPILRDARPRLGLLSLPAIDTLTLSPLAFPENPYHRLVKDYKLVRASRNDPVEDARLAARVFHDQWTAFAALFETEPELASLYRFCFAGAGSGESRRGRGLTPGFGGRGARPLTSGGEAIRIFADQAAGKACARAVREVGARFGDRDDDRRELAYLTAWLRVSGGKSVLPPWVRLRYPEIAGRIRKLRDTPCHEPSCSYCRETHDPEGQLERFFGFPGFRSTAGEPLQREIVVAAMEDEPLLAILPTGGGKSLCFQLPALVRHQRRGALTIVISPLQALMKDQVEGLERRTRTAHAGALYGMITPPERREVLERVRLGDIAILYVSPEQLRNRSFRSAISFREIGCWVFDEAHCISKWGHDFRPDYFYATRFIREMAKMQKTPVPTVACFTATAKPDVEAEIAAHVSRELGRELRVFRGSLRRENLRFAVGEVTRPEKLERVRDLLAEGLFADGTDGAAIVYRATRRGAEETAGYLESGPMPARAFHGGLPPPAKREIQEAFLSGEIPVISATNAFGMGVDKPDVRLVVHADIPGSLESYLQEAGRAGRDQRDSDCVLLYDEQDIETQFRLAGLSRISRRDIMGILRGLRRVAGNTSISVA